MAWLCFGSWKFEPPLTSPGSYERNLFSLPEIDNSKWRVDQFANRIQVELRNNPASIWVELEHFATLQDSSHEIITDMWIL